MKTEYHSKLPRPIKVMIVDDSVVIRSIIDKILKTDTNIKVCGYAGSGDKAVESITLCDPDIVLLDIEMPVMDGITAIPLLLKKKPDVRIIMCSTLSDRGADVSIRALSLGATDCILKPSGASSIQGARDFHSELLTMVKTIGESAIGKANFTPEVKTRQISTNHAPKILAIGSSTGGPNALEVVLKDLKNLSVPIVITQHMPKTFTRILAKHLTTVVGLPCFEGEDGMMLKAGCAYIAPGGFHMEFKNTPQGTAIILNDGPMENFCKPSVNPMLRSLGALYGDAVFTVILTGMGEDGLTGAETIVKAGGTVIAQDAATSIVWGMPGAVAEAGLCTAILPLKDIGPRIRKAFSTSLFSNLSNKTGECK